MNDESLRRHLRSALDTPAMPRDEFAAELHDDLAARLRLAPPRATAVASHRRRPHRSTWLLLAATLALLIALLAGLAAAGALPDLLPRGVPVMRQIQIDGQVRVAVRPDRPQALSPGGTLDGFDVRVAEEVATRLGVDAARSTLTVQEMLGPTPAWQLALPSQSLPRGRADEYIASTPYYFWPHYIVVASASPASSIADLADETVCAAQGSAGQSWLSEMESLVPRVLADESACEASVRSGESQAFVSERRLLPDFASDGAFRALSEQPVLLEPRAMLVPRSLPGAREFVAEIDLLIEEMRADGTISELSRTWFGGQDLAR